MKTIICQFLLLQLIIVALSYKAEAASAEETAAMAKKFSEECVKEGTLSAEDTARIMSNEIFSPKHATASDKLQCFMLCYYKKVGIIGADGKQKPEAIMGYLTMRFADKKDKIPAALAKCNDIKSANPCEVVYKFEGCIMQNIMA